MITYTDTVSMYYTFQAKYPYSLQLPNTWIFNNSNNDAYLHHWYIKLDSMYISFYPDMYGCGRLFATYSLPKLLKGRNTFNIIDFDIDSTYQLIMDELAVFPWVILAPYDRPSSFKDWECSRIDLFIMHPIPIDSRDDYMDAYELLTLPRYRSVRYQNTCYINSSLRPDKKANKVFRAYPKLQEIKDRLSVENPDDVDKMHEEYLQINECKTDVYRFEFMLRRSIVKYECKRYGIHPNMYEVLQQQFQEQLLSKMISAVGLDRQILCKNDYKKEVNKLFRTDKTKQNALLLARSIRSNQKVPLTYNQISHVKSTLKKNNIHFITHKYINIKPVIFP